MQDEKQAVGCGQPTIDDGPKRYGWPGIIKYMPYFWYRVACPRPDGWGQIYFSWLFGGPYNWTKRLAYPWYQLDEHVTPWLAKKRFMWVKFILSFLLIPWGLTIRYIFKGSCWPLLPKCTDGAGYTLGFVL